MKTDMLIGALEDAVAACINSNRDTYPEADRRRTSARAALREALDSFDKLTNLSNSGIKFKLR